MSVALATMDSTHGLSRLGMTSHHHHLFHPYNLHHHSSSSSRHHRAGSPDNRQQAESAENSALRFSVANILRPDFGREAILTTRTSPKTTPIKVTPLPIHSPLSLPRDLSLSSSRLSPLSPPPSSSSASSHCGLSSPVQRPGLSRSGSLESLASNRSSVTGGSINGAASVSSAASSAGAESVSGDSTSGSTLPTPGTTSNQSLWPAWIYCTRYSDRPSSGPRSRRMKKPSTKSAPTAEKVTSDEKRPRTAFSNEQLAKLRQEFAQNKYLNEQRRQKLSNELGLNEQQIKIWFQNKRAKAKKATGQKNPLALQLMAQGLYNHSTMSVDEDEEDISR